MTGKLYQFLNLAKKLMSPKFTSRHSISSQSVFCTSPSSPQLFASKCPITESSSGAVSQRGQGWLHTVCACAKYSALFSVKSFVHFLVHMRMIILTKNTELSLRYTLAMILTYRTLLGYFLDVLVSFFQM